MIQIKGRNLENLAQEHYEKIEPYIKANLNNKVGQLYKYIKTNLEQIIKGKPKELKDIIQNFPAYDNSSIKKIFDYDRFIDKKRKYNAYLLAERLKVNVCPYCNRQYTFTINKGNKGVRPDFDHFYCQKDYPYLALSFYNLIPSCHICNSNFKKDEKFDIDTHIHPYTEGFENDVRFTILLNPKSGIDIFYGIENSFEICLNLSTLDLEKKEKVKRNITVFKLNIIYNEHKDYVKEILQRSILYEDTYLENLFNQYEGTLFKSLGEVQRMALSNYVQDEDLEKRVLSKLTKDISEELGIL
ncbi:hypothetical protein [Emticicia fontis]